MSVTFALIKVSDIYNDGMTWHAGVWVDEFAAMGLDDCLDHIWDRAEVYLDSKAQDKKYASTEAY